MLISFATITLINLDDRRDLRLARSRHKFSVFRYPYRNALNKIQDTVKL